MRLLVPATTTNFGAGFDTFGLALNLYNTFEFEESDAFGVEIEGEGKELPRDENNLVVKVYKRACEVFAVSPKPFRLKQINRVPTARGLGSSATAIVGGIEACVRIHSVQVSLDEKLKVAFEFEPHPDNLLPAFVGGFVVCVQNGELRFNRLEFPKDLSLVFVVPDFELSTEEARRVIKRELPLKDAVFNIQRASLFVSALLTGRYELFRVAVEDRLHQPYRAGLVKGFGRVLEAGYSAGAYAVFLSGAGPTVCAITSDASKTNVGNSMKEAFKREGVSSKVLYLKSEDRGSFWESTTPP